MSGFQWNTSRLGVIHVMEGGGFAENLEINSHCHSKKNPLQLVMILFQKFVRYCI